MTPNNQRATADAERCHRATAQTGWRYPRDLIAEIYLQAELQGLRPGAYATRLLWRALEQQAQPISAKELEQRVRFPEWLRRSQ